MTRIRGCESAEIRNQPELLAEYAAEASIRAIGTISPQWEVYAAMEAAGFLQVFAADVDGRMVGFAAVICNLSPHYGVNLAIVESLFVSKGWRGTRAGAEMMRVAERYARGVGCVAFGRWRNGRSHWKNLR